MPLINCKIHLALNWTKDCIMSTIADTTFNWLGAGSHNRGFKSAVNSNVHI